MKLGLLGALLFALIGIYPWQQAAAPSATHSSSEARSKGWVLIWSDEFDGPDGSRPDPTKWSAMDGGNGFGNNELEYYTARLQNVRIEGGHLVLEAVKESYAGRDGRHREFTSARVSSRGRFSRKYGRFEARIQVPRGQGVWPAFWLLGSDVGTVGWPACGEIDVMENVGREPAKIIGSLHGPGYSGENPLISAYALRRGKFSDGFHIFAVEWEPEIIRFYVDGELFATRTPADIPAGKPWVFDHPFFIILNLAVGGDLPGNPDETSVFPQRMLVDYIRVYARK